MEENTIRETLKGLEIALATRKDKVSAIENKDDTELIEAKKAELQKKLEEELNAFVADIDNEKKNALDKLNRDIETIDELIAEYTEELEKIGEDETETEDGGDIVEEETVDAQDTVEGQEQIETVETVQGTGNPFRP